MVIKTTLSMQHIRALNVPAIIAFIALPFMQLGVSYYVSVNVICFCMLVLLSYRGLSFEVLCLSAVAGVCFIAKSLYGYHTTHEIKELLLPVREWICFTGLILIADSMMKWGVSRKQCSLYALVALAILFAMVLVQAVAISRGALVGYPQEWFVRNSATLEQAELLMKLSGRWRPTSFYGEPSYTAFVTLTMLVIGLKSTSDFRVKLACVILSILIAAISQTLAGVGSVVVLTALHGVVTLAGQRKFGALLGMTGFGIVVLGIALAQTPRLAERMGNVVAGRDRSTAMRFEVPLRLASGTISEGRFLGMSNDEMEERSRQNQVDNALMRLFIFYGLLAFPIVLALVGFIRNLELIVYLLLVMNFNGDIFAFDKAVVVGLALGLALARAGYVDNSSGIARGDDFRSRERLDLASSDRLGYV